MISVEHHPEENLVEVHAAGKLSREDYDNVVPRLESWLSHEQPLDFLVQLENFQGWHPGAFAREVALDVQHRSQFGRMAVIGDGRLAEWSTEMSNFFFPSEVRYFSRGQAEEARDWLRHRPAGPQLVTG